jgi:hypothetical protein
MDPYEVYRLYLALRLHFTKEDYDITKTKGGVRPSREAFMKRKDLYSIRKLAQTKSKQEIINFLVANFVSGNRWGGIFDSESNEVYNHWNTKMQRLTYQFTQDIQTMYSDSDPLESTNNQHPTVLKMYLGGKISLESIAILDKIVKFTSRDYGSLSDDFIWKDFIHLVKKYRPFVKIDKEKFTHLFEKESGVVVN